MTTVNDDALECFIAKSANFPYEVWLALQGGRSEWNSSNKILAHNGFRA